MLRGGGGAAAAEGGAQLPECVAEALRLRGVEEVEGQHVDFEREGLQVQHGAHEGGALDLRLRDGRHVLLEVLFSVEPEAEARLRAPGAPRALHRLDDADRAHDEGFHPGRRIVFLLLHQARVDDVDDPRDGQGGLGEVGGHHAAAAALGRRGKDARLHLGGQRGVEGEDLEVRAVRGGQGGHARVQLTDLRRSEADTEGGGRRQMCEWVKSIHSQTLCTPV